MTAQLPVAPFAGLDLAGLDALAIAGLLVFLPEDAVPLAGLAGLVDWRLCGALSRHLQAQSLQAGADVPALLPGRAPLRARAVLACGLRRAAWSDPAALRRTVQAAAVAARGVHNQAWAVLEPALGPRFDSGQERALQHAFAAAVHGCALPADWLRVRLSLPIR